MNNEFCALASAIEAGNVPLPPNLSRLIEAAPESFDDLRNAETAVALRAMREAGEPVNGFFCAGVALGEVCAKSDSRAGFSCQPFKRIQ